MPIDEASRERLVPTTRYRVALGVAGGIAAYKAAEVLRGLQGAGCDVRVCMTARATEFIRPLTFRALSGAHVVTDDYAPDNPDPIAHITFSQTIDLLVVAPATANLLAKFANGIADDFLTSTYLAATAPILVAPAMNTTMWLHPATARNVERLRADGVRIVEPEAGMMACGTTGPGRLAEPSIIVRAALDILSRGDEHALDLNNERVLITAGGTREAIDPVRFIANRSSGRMGFALAEAAAARGAQVALIAGTTSAIEPAHGNIKIERVTSAAEMHRAVTHEINRATIFIAAAAVADYRPSHVSAEKIKKSDAALTLTLEPTADILADVSLNHRRPDLLVIGFAAESHDLIRHATDKLRGKNLDLIVANDITQSGSGFDSETNVVTLIDNRDPTPRTLPQLAKRDAAQRILDRITELRSIQVSHPLTDADLSSAAQSANTFANGLRHDPEPRR